MNKTLFKIIKTACIFIENPIKELFQYTWFQKILKPKSTSEELAALYVDKALSGNLVKIPDEFSKFYKEYELFLERHELNQK